MNNLDPRLKIGLVFCFIALVSAFHHWLTLVVALGFFLLLTFLTKLSFLKFMHQIIWVLPLTGLLVIFLPLTTPGETLRQFGAGFFWITVTKEGITKALILSLRLFTSLLALNLLIATTSFYNLMGALRALRVPVVFVKLIELTWRYLFVLQDELQRMLFARRARGFKPGSNLGQYFTFKVLGQLIGVLFLRSWERGERIYWAMVARGFTEKDLPSANFKFKVSDLGWGIGFFIFVLGLILLETGKKGGLTLLTLLK